VSIAAKGEITMKPDTRNKNASIYLILLAVGLLLLFVLTGCQSEPSLPEPDNPSQSHDTTPADDNQETAPAGDNNIDEGPLPAATDKLLLYIDPARITTMEQAIAIFKDRFPDVDVEIHDFEGNQQDGDMGWTDRFIYTETLQDDLLVGNGPDLITFDVNDFLDINKTIMNTDLFFDMEPLMQADPDFTYDDYVQSAFDAGMLHGRRLYIPLNYMMFVFFTTEESLERNNLTLGSRPGFEELMEQAGNYCEAGEAGGDRRLFQMRLGMDMIFPFSGRELLDYENYAVKVAGDDFRMIMEAFKRVYETDKNTTPAFASGADEEARMHLDQQTLFTYHTSSNSFVGTYSAVSSVETPVWFPFPTQSGIPVAHNIDLAAIRNNTPNVRNAYEFLKILLEEEMQNATLTPWYPVNIAALRARPFYYSENHTESYGAAFDGMPLTQVPDEVLDELVNYAIGARALQTFIPRYVRDMIYEEMTPFFKGNQDYEECLASLENRLLIYIGE